jgi:hypothetical protein
MLASKEFLFVVEFHRILSAFRRDSWELGDLEIPGEL